MKATSLSVAAGGAAVGVLALTVGVASSVAAGDEGIEALRAAGAPEEDIDVLLHWDDYAGKLRLRGVPEAEIEEVYKRLLTPPHPPTAEQLVAGLPERESELIRRVGRREGGVALAREILLRPERAGKVPDYAALRGLEKVASTDALELLQEAVLLHEPIDPLKARIRKTWAGIFRNLHRNNCFELAKEAVGDTSLSAEQRALYLHVFQYAQSGNERQMALDVYRPYLHSEIPALQRAALEVSLGIWDYDARAGIEQVAWSNTHARIRQLAHTITEMFLIVGPTRRERDGDVITIHDPESLIAYQERDAEWREQQRRLEASENPAVSDKGPPAQVPGGYRPGRE